MISIEDISVSYGNKVVLDHFSLELVCDGLTAQAVWKMAEEAGAGAKA